MALDRPEVGQVAEVAAAQAVLARDEQRLPALLRHQLAGALPAAVALLRREPHRGAIIIAPMEAAVTDFLDRARDRHVGELSELLRIPSVSTASEHAPDMEAAARWLLGHLERIGLEGVRLLETGGNPIVYGDWLHARRADRAGLRPLRRPALGARRAVDLAAVRARGPRRPPLRARSHRQQGPDLRGARSARGAARRRRLAPVQRPRADRGRGGAERRQPDRVPDRERRLRASSGRPGADHRLRHVRRAHPRVTTALRGWRRSSSRSGPPPPTSTPASTAASRRTRSSRWPSCSRRCATRTTGRILVDGFYDDVLPIPEAERQAWASLPHDEQELAARARPARASPASPASPRSNGCGAARRST